MYERYFELFSKNRVSSVDVSEQFDVVNKNLAVRGDARDPTKNTSLNPFNQGFRSRRSDLPVSFRRLRGDIDPNSAICLTRPRQFDIAPMFPRNLVEETWLYFVHVDVVFQTYKKQIAMTRMDLSFAKEIAVKEVSHENIICAIKCKRFFYPHKLEEKEITLNADAGLHYRLVSEIVWNPNVKEAYRVQHAEAIRQLIELRRNQYIICPVPKMSTDVTAMINEVFDKKFYQLKTISKTEHDCRLQLIKFAQIFYKIVKVQGENTLNTTIKNLMKPLILKNILHLEIPGLNKTLLDLAKSLLCHQDIIDFISNNTVTPLPVEQENNNNSTAISTVGFFSPPTPQTQLRSHFENMKAMMLPMSIHKRQVEILDQKRKILNNYYDLNFSKNDALSAENHLKLKKDQILEVDNIFWDFIDEVKNDQDSIQRLLQALDLLLEYSIRFSNNFLSKYKSLYRILCEEVLTEYEGFADRFMQLVKTQGIDVDQYLQDAKHAAADFNQTLGSLGKIYKELEEEELSKVLKAIITPQAEIKAEENSDLSYFF